MARLRASVARRPLAEEAAAPAARDPAEAGVPLAARGATKPMMGREAAAPPRRTPSPWWQFS
eukprot:4631770-Lingulodinium_polyedra.AAC.1